MTCKTIAQILHQKTFPLEIVALNETITYYENANEYWEICKYDSDGDECFYEDSKGYTNDYFWDGFYKK